MMFNFADSFKAKLERLVNINAASKLTDEQFIVREINKFKLSQRRKEMLDGERYFDGCHDILSRERTVIGKDGDLEVVKNLPNNINTANRVIAEALVNLNERISNIESMIENGFPSLTVDTLTITRALFTRIALGSAFTAKAGAPTTIPDGALQFYRNTSDGSIYISVGSDSASDWVKIK